MSEEVPRVEIDKSTWGDGPWQTEPDRVDWIQAGLACMALRHPDHGHWCGYVGVPREHPFYGKDYREVENAVPFHGGLTYSGLCEGSICHVPAAGMPADVWWLGGDFAHAFDYVPGSEARTRAIIAAPQPTRELQALADRLLVPSPREMQDVYRALPYVRKTVNRCARALAAMMEPRP
jgi:hypothetical protein